MRANFVTVMVMFSKVAFRKLLDHRYVQSSFYVQRNTAVEDFTDNGSAYVLILSSRL